MYAIRSYYVVVGAVIGQVGVHAIRCGGYEEIGKQRSQVGHAPHGDILGERPLVVPYDHEFVMNRIVGNGRLLLIVF